MKPRSSVYLHVPPRVNTSSTRPSQSLSFSSQASSAASTLLHTGSIPQAVRATDLKTGPTLAFVAAARARLPRLTFSNRHRDIETQSIGDNCHILDRADIHILAVEFVCSRSLRIRTQRSPSTPKGVPIGPRLHSQLPTKGPALRIRGTHVASLSNCTTPCTTSRYSAASLARVRSRYSTGKRSAQRKKVSKLTSIIAESAPPIYAARSV